MSRVDLAAYLVMASMHHIRSVCIACHCQWFGGIMSEYTKITVEKARISENFATHGWNYVCTIVQVDTLSGIYRTVATNCLGGTDSLRVIL